MKKNKPALVSWKVKLYTRFDINNVTRIKIQKGVSFLAFRVKGNGKIVPVL
jgi:hypothetical protein